ncbi:hypothetical protein TNCV_3674831 [Trichonephila clavipes]|nr:hypothetical protein TNCV_3674831 [Trichonephila clavipes]
MLDHQKAEGLSESFPSEIDGYRLRARYGVQNKCSDLVGSAIILHDNARPEKTECVRQLSQRSGCGESEHPPSCPGILPSNFDLFPKINKPTRGGDLQYERTLLMRQQVTRFTHGAASAKADGIQLLPQR